MHACHKLKLKSMRLIPYRARPTNKKSFIKHISLISLLGFVITLCSFLYFQDKPKLYLTSSCGGRLGNHMFIYASLYALARSTGRTLLLNHGCLSKTFLPNLTYHAPLLPSTDDDDTVVWEEEEYHVRHYNPFLYPWLQNQTATTVHMNGYFQSYRIFEPYFSEIRKEFTLSHVLKTEVSGILHQIKNETKWQKEHSHKEGVDVLFVGVHVRRTDMLTEAHIKAKRGLTIGEYYETSFDYFEKMFPQKHIIFIVCSDDSKFKFVITDHRRKPHDIDLEQKVNSDYVEEEVKKDYNSDYNNVNEDEDKEYVGTYPQVLKKRYSLWYSPFHGKTYNDFALLTLCNHTIMSPESTFSWWGAFLAGGLVVYPRFYVDIRGQSTGIRKNDDYYLSHWVAI